MRNILKCSSLLRMAVIIVVMVFMVGQVAETKAGGWDWKGDDSTSGGGWWSRHHKDVCCDEILDKLDQIIGDCVVSIPETGQTESNGIRDDGELEIGADWPNPRFKDNGDGTIKDNLTCLIWDQNANRFGTRNWNNALSDCNGLDDGAVGDGSSVGDWRLPNRLELASLLHLGYVTPAVPNTAGTGQWADGDPFNNVQSKFYWSSTTDAFVTDSRWFVSMNGGTVDGRDKDDTNDPFYVWCVKGGK